MYHKEEIINGVLCYKTTPDGEWQQYSKEFLASRIADLTERLNNANARLAIYQEFKDATNKIFSR